MLGDVLYIEVKVSKQCSAGKIATDNSKPLRQLGMLDQMLYSYRRPERFIDLRQTFPASVTPQDTMCFVWSWWSVVSVILVIIYSLRVDIGHRDM